MDTSVVVKWFSRHGEDDLAQAMELRDQVARGKCQLIAPDLLLYELANALRFNPDFSQDDVRDALASILNIGVDCRPPDSMLIRRAVEIAYRLGTTVYDACFLALAEITDGIFITADRAVSAAARRALRSSCLSGIGPPMDNLRMRSGAAAIHPGRSPARTPIIQPRIGPAGRAVARAPLQHVARARTRTIFRMTSRAEARDT